jgi:hypothetical protein
VSCPYCHADNRTDITYSCWTKVGDDELARSERCLRNEIKQHKERIRRLEEAGDALDDLLGHGVTMRDEKRKASKQWHIAKESP